MKKYFLSCVFLYFSFCHSQKILDFYPKQIIGGIGEVLTISGNGFGQSQGLSYVSLFNENNKFSNESEGKLIRYLSWNDKEIKIEMPNAFSNKLKVIIINNEYLSSDTLHVNANLGYRQLYPLTHDFLTNMNGSGGVTWYIHPTYWKNIEIKQAIIDVVREFRCKSGVNYSVAELKKWLPLSTVHKMHIIAPDSNLNVVGYNEKLWSSCIVGTESLYHNQTQLIRISSKEKWYYGIGKAPNGTSKFRYVLFHEMGHSLGLGHVNEIGQTMFPSVTNLPSDNWSGRDTISSSEKRAITLYIDKCQNFTFRGCGITPMLPITNCNNVEFNATNQNKLVTLKDAFDVYPNPCHTGKVYIIHNENQNIHPQWVNVINHYGQLVHSSVMNSNEPIILPENLSQGVYTINFHVHNTQYSYLLNILE